MGSQATVVEGNSRRKRLSFSGFRSFPSLFPKVTHKFTFLIWKWIKIMLRISGIQNNNIETNDKKNIWLFKIKVIFPVSFSFYNDIYLTVWQSTTFIYNEQFCRVRQRYFANDHKISALAKLILGLIGRRSMPILYKGKFSVLSYKLVGGD